MNSETFSNRKNSFAIRLKQQLELKGKTSSPTALAREFNLRWRGVPVTTNAVRKWLQGDSLPTMDKMEVLANMLGTSTDWLRWGNVEYASSTSELRSDLAHHFKESLPIENMEKAVIQDYRLLNTTNKKLVFSLMEIMLKEQKSPG